MRPLGRVFRAFFVFFWLAFASFYALAQGGPTFDPQILISSDPDDVVLTYSETPDMIANADTTPRVTVFASGRVLVHYPRYMKKAGDYEVWLSRGQTMQLLRAAAEIVEFDAQVARSGRDQAKAEKAQATGVVSYRSDAVLEEFDITLEGYSAEPGGDSQAVKKSAQWRDLPFDARAYPSVGELQRLSRAREAVRELLDHPDLTRIYLVREAEGELAQ